MHLVSQLGRLVVYVVSDPLDAGIQLPEFPLNDPLKVLRQVSFLEVRSLRR